ncbi:MAG: TRAM domain-containing protein, partial [Dehalococcoidia bacterium]
MADAQDLTITLTDIAHGGDAIGRDDGRVIFARYGIPGETAEVQVLRQRRDYAQGRVTRVLDPSPHRTTPPCPYFGVCGGCQWQHIDYPFQLELKRKILKEQLERIAKIDNPYVTPTLPSPDPWHYRNHARFSVDRKGNLGFIRADDYRHLEIAYCHLMHPEINATLAGLQGRCRGTRQITVRHGVETGDLLIQPS